MIHVLLIDDDALLRKMLRLRMEHLGYRVTEASNGAAGLRQQVADPAAVVVTDIVMPDSEGLETILAFRRQHPRVPIIAMSGGGNWSSAGDYLAMAKKFGAAGVLAKPFSVDELEVALRRAIDAIPENDPDASEAPDHDV